MNNNAWKLAARKEIKRLAATQRPFTADDLHRTVPPPDEAHSPNARNNLIGQAFREARAAGLIEPIGVVQSRQPHRKGGMIRVWQGRQTQGQLL